MSPWVSENQVNRPARDVLIKHLVNLCRIFSPSGYELGVINYCVPVLRAAGFTVEVSPEGNIYAVRGKPASGKYILLNAHTDTVQRDQDAAIMAHPEIVQYDPFWSLIWGRGYMVGGDDKCGVGIILALAEATNAPFKVLLTVGEESGCHGVNAVPDSFYNDVVFCYTLDRRNCCDIIETYATRKMCPKGLVDLIVEVAKDVRVNMSVGAGSFADTHAISAHVPAVNMSVGYYNAHTPYDFIRVNETYDTMMIVRASIDRQAEFEYEWARTPHNWRPKIYKEYARPHTQYTDYYQGGGFGWGMGYDDRVTSVNATISKFEKVWDKKTRNWISKTVKEERDASAKDVSKLPLDPSTLIAKDDVEPTLKDPFGSSYGDLMWAERYNPAWEAITAYPRTKEERRYAATTGVSPPAKKEMAVPPSDFLIEEEKARLAEIVEYMVSQPSYVWVMANGMTYEVKVTARVEDEPSDIVIGWVQYKLPDGDIAHRPILNDATSVFEFSRILNDYPEQEVVYKAANLAVDVTSRIDESQEDEHKFEYRSFPTSQYNAFADAAMEIDLVAVPFKIKTVDGAIYEAVFTKQVGIDGWNSVGRVTVFVVAPTSPDREGWKNAARTLKETMYVYGNRISLNYLRKLFYGRGSAKFDAAIDAVDKTVIEWFSKPDTYEVQKLPQTRLTGTGMSEDFIDEITKYLTMSSDKGMRRVGIPWALRDAVRLEELDGSQAEAFADIIARIGTFEGSATYVMHPASVIGKSSGTSTEVQKFEYREDIDIAKIMDIFESGDLTANTRIGSKRKTAFGRTDVIFYESNIKDVLTLYHDISIILNDYTLNDAVIGQLEVALVDLELLMEDIITQWEAKVGEALEEEEWRGDDVREYENYINTGGCARETGCADKGYPKGGPDTDYEFVMPFFNPNKDDSQEILTPSGLSNLAKQYPDIRLTVEEISCLSAGIANYDYLVRTFSRAWTKDGQEVDVRSIGAIDPSAEYIAQFEVRDLETKEMMWRWKVEPNISGIASMYFASKRLTYDSEKVNLVIRYFAAIAYYVYMRVKSGSAIVYDESSKKFVIADLSEWHGAGPKLKEKKEKKEKKGEKKKKDQVASPAVPTAISMAGFGEVHKFVEATLRAIHKDHVRSHPSSDLFRAASRLDGNTVEYRVMLPWKVLEFKIHTINGKPEFFGTVWIPGDTISETRRGQKMIGGISSTPISALDSWIRTNFNLPARVGALKVEDTPAKSNKAYDRELERSRKKDGKAGKGKDYKFDDAAYKREDRRGGIRTRHGGRRGSSSEYTRDYHNVP